jgi:Acetyltransferase (GNAT) domain
VRVIATGSAARDAWHRALAGDRDALVSQTPTWLDCVCACGPFEDATRVYRADDGRELVLPLARLRGTPGAAPIESSLPFGWSAGGLVAAGRRPSADEVAGVVRDLAGRRALRIAVRPAPGARGVWVAAVARRGVEAQYTTYSLDLADGFDEIWKRRFSSSVRGRVRRAERAGIEVEWADGAALIDVFDALYRRSVDRWARQQNEPLPLARWRARRRDPRRKFEEVAMRLGADCRVWVARRGGEPAAAIVVLSHGEHSTYWRGAMDKDLVAGTGANELLHRLAIEEACNSGRSFYHMGEAAPDSSLARFKRRLGAVAAEGVGYRFERLPLTATEQLVRGAVKRALRFRD